MSEDKITSSAGGRKLRVVHISDTHMGHNSLKPSIPPGDILVHSGDFLDVFSLQDFKDCLSEMDTFFSNLPHQYKIFVAGNHEICFGDKTAQEIKDRLPHAIYLQDEAVVIQGLKFYGSPWNTDRGSRANAFVASEDMLQKYWDQIPGDTDILVTHSPPHRIHDNLGAMGCRILREQVTQRIRPKAHLFGHAHRSGMSVIDGTLYSNAACPHPTNKPYVFDVITDSSASSDSVVHTVDL